MAIGGVLQNYDDDEYDIPGDKPTKGQNGKRKHSLASAIQAPQMASIQQDSEQPNLVYLMSVLSAMGGFLFGYDTGIVSGAMVFVKKTFNLNSLWQELVVSITILGAWKLALLAGGLSERYGRKSMILWASVIFTLGSVTMGLAWSRYVLLFGRWTVGVAIGIASTVVPMYIAEVAPQNIRGSLVTVNTCFITFGQLSAAVTAGAFSYDHENGWRWMLALAAVPSTVQFFGFIFMPESPRWLIRRGRDAEALDALKRIRGPKNPYLMKEFEKIKRNQADLLVQEERRRTQKRNIFVAILKKTVTRRALFVGCLLQAAQQLAGINTVMYYTATIIEMSGVQSQSIAVWLAVPTAAVFVLFSFCGYLLADKIGRRTLTLGSLMGVILSLIILATGFQLTSNTGALVTTHNMSTLESCYSKRDCSSCIADPRCGFCYNAQDLAVSFCLEKNPNDQTRSEGGECAEGLGNSNFVFANHICPSMTQGIGLNTWLVLTGLVLYLAAFAPGMSCTPWTINAEIYPMWARSFCYSIATSVNWIFNLLISLTFISLTEVLTTHGTFYLYAIISTILWFVIFWKLPETRGKSLEDISNLFAKNKSESEDMMDDDNSNNPASLHGVPTGGALASGATPINISRSGQRHSVISGHDNGGFAGDLQSQLPLALSKSVPNTDPSSMAAVGRTKSFKTSNPLSRAAAMALSQPDLLAQQQQQQLGYRYQCAGLSQQPYQLQQPQNQYHHQYHGSQAQAQHNPTHAGYQKQDSSPYR